MAGGNRVTCCFLFYYQPLRPKNTDNLFLFKLFVVPLQGNINH